LAPDAFISPLETSAGHLACRVYYGIRSWSTAFPNSPKYPLTDKAQDQIRGIQIWPEAMQ
jgi:hypothetical protein